MKNTINDFFKINIWHIVILLSWLISGVWFTSKWTFTIDVLDKRISSSERQIESVLSNMSDLKDNNIRYANFDLRITKLEQVIAEVSTLRTDISWIKAYLSGNTLPKKVPSNNEQSDNR